VARHTDSETLAQIAYWYYVQELSQEDIAQRIGVNRSQVSRMLRTARQQRVVRFQIQFPTTRNADLEEAVRQRFRHTPLREVIVARSPSPGGAESAEAGVMTVARAAADWLPRHLEDDMILGLSWGGTIQMVVDLVEFSRPVDVRVVQLAGEVSLDARHSGHDLVRDLADRVGGRRNYFNAAAVVPTPELARALIDSPHVREALKLARASSVGLLGIGEFNRGMSKIFLDQADITDAERREARAKGAIGQVCGRFFDRSGQQVDLELHQRILSVSIDELRQIPLKIVVASGAGKAGPTAAALSGGLISILIVDDTLAAQLVSSE
jgi:deoxyribonucleoside regulator